MTVLNDPAAQIRANKAARKQIARTPARQGPPPRSAMTTPSPPPGIGNSLPTNPETMARDKKIMVDKKTYSDLKHGYAERGTKIIELQDQAKSAEGENTSLHQEKDALIQQSSELKAKLKWALEDLEAERASKKTKSKKSLQKQDISDAIHAHIRDYTSQNIKFAKPGDELNAITMKIWNEIKDAQKLDQGDKPLNEKEFVRIYASVVSAELSLSHQYVQSRGQMAAKGTKNVALDSWFGCSLPLII